MSHILAQAQTPQVFRRTKAPVPPMLTPTSSIVTPSPLSSKMPVIMKPPLPAPLVQPSAVPTSTPAPPSSSSVSSLRQTFQDANLPPNTLQVFTQVVQDQQRLLFKALETKIEAKLESLVKDTLGTAIRDLKTQYESTEIRGQTLVAHLPVFARPDPKSTVEFSIEQVNTTVRLFKPFISNAYGYWVQTRHVTSNGSVVMGYVPVFCKPLASVTLSITDDELTRRKREWSPFLDELTDKEFLPYIGYFA